MKADHEDSRVASSGTDLAQSTVRPTSEPPTKIVLLVLHEFMSSALTRRSRPYAKLRLLETVG